MGAIILIYVVNGLLWGYACNAVLKYKGYLKNWFVLGFFFGIIPFIVVLLQPDYKISASTENTIYDKQEQQGEMGTNNEAAQQLLNRLETYEGHKLEILKKYKELLDSGVITEEVYKEKMRLYTLGSVEETPKENVPRMIDPSEKKDWKCSYCGADNQPERTSCYFCATKRVL